jgi:hypothetical protein
LKNKVGKNMEEGGMGRLTIDPENEKKVIA